MQSLVFLFYFNRLKFPEMKAFKILAVNIANKKNYKDGVCQHLSFRRRPVPKKSGGWGEVKQQGLSKTKISYSALFMQSIHKHHLFPK